MNRAQYAWNVSRLTYQTPFNGYALLTDCSTVPNGFMDDLVAGNAVLPENLDAWFVEVRGKDTSVVRDIISTRSFVLLQGSGRVIPGSVINNPTLILCHRDHPIPRNYLHDWSDIWNWGAVVLRWRRRSLADYHSPLQCALNIILTSFLWLLLYIPRKLDQALGGLIAFIIRSR